jgi:hypothetical protein
MKFTARSSGCALTWKKCCLQVREQLIDINSSSFRSCFSGKVRLKSTSPTITEPASAGRKVEIPSHTLCQTLIYCSVPVAMTSFGHWQLGTGHKSLPLFRSTAERTCGLLDGQQQWLEKGRQNIKCNCACTPSKGPSRVGASSADLRPITDPSFASV